jgi:hypothetical protein
VAKKRADAAAADRSTRRAYRDTTDPRFDYAPHRRPGAAESGGLVRIGGRASVSSGVEDTHLVVAEGSSKPGVEVHVAVDDHDDGHIAERGLSMCGCRGCLSSETPVSDRRRSRFEPCGAAARMTPNRRRVPCLVRRSKSGPEVVLATLSDSVVTTTFFRDEVA